MRGSYYTGPTLPRPPSCDSNEDREMDFGDHHDFMDQDVPAGQFPNADPGPIHQFLSGIPDWLNFNPSPEDLWKAFSIPPTAVAVTPTARRSLAPAVQQGDRAPCQ
jgi:hypothetical protein